jgi:uncharacterized Zn finger protein (UPF0148 family)
MTSTTIGEPSMLKRRDVVCPVCGHAVFVVHRGHFHCCRCGANADEVITDSQDAKATETKVQPDDTSTSI